jgi:hypothetical protein
MSDINRKRAFVYDLYPYRGWQKKVNRMSDNQIIAIYLREFNKPADPKPADPKHEENSDGGDDIPF